MSRARKHLTSDQRDSVDATAHRKLLHAFVAAAQQGDVAGLEALLTPDAVSLSDGNGIRGAARVPVLGRARVANLSTAHPRFWPTTEAVPVEANGRGGILLHRDGRPATFMTIAATSRGIHQVMWVFNPAKITAFLHSAGRSAAGQPCLSTRPVASYRTRGRIQERSLSGLRTTQICTTRESAMSRTTTAAT